MIKKEDVYQIGRIGKPHGVKGEVLFHFSDDVFDRAESEYLILEVDGILVPFFMEEYRFRSDETALVRFCDINTQEQARQLTGSDVYSCAVRCQPMKTVNSRGHKSLVSPYATMQPMKMQPPSAQSRLSTILPSTPYLILRLPTDAMCSCLPATT